MPSIEPEVVLLESPAVLAELLSAWPVSRSRIAGRPRHAQTTIEEPQRTRQHRSRVCSCGACGRCRDNARWNRIFDEKFADPSYYSHISVRHNSSLAGI